jgi:hypothetical protein
LGGEGEEGGGEEAESGGAEEEEDDPFAEPALGPRLAGR